MKSNQKERSGQSLVELAISLIVILMLLLGTVEIGLALFQYITIRDAAQEGAVYGSIHPQDETDIKDRAVDTVSDVLPQLTAAAVTVTINNKTVADATSDKEACEGMTKIDGIDTPNFITVKVTFEHPISFPLVAPMLGTDTISLNAIVTNTILRSKCIP